jgi:GNAT superfamily N-acetyltransferase
MKGVFDPWEWVFLPRLIRFHRGFRYSDVFIVLDEKSHKIVSFLCLVRFKSVLGGVELQCGQMEVVGTLPQYRRRGLIRALNAAFEERVSEYKLDFVVIAGIFAAAQSTVSGSTNSAATAASAVPIPKVIPPPS